MRFHVDVALKRYVRPAKQYMYSVIITAKWTLTNRKIEKPHRPFARKELVALGMHPGHFYAQLRLKILCSRLILCAIPPESDNGGLLGICCFGQHGQR